jgi:hypothetical protein
MMPCQNIYLSATTPDRLKRCIVIIDGETPTLTINALNLLFPIQLYAKALGTS